MKNYQLQFEVKYSIVLKALAQHQLSENQKAIYQKKIEDLEELKKAVVQGFLINMTAPLAKWNKRPAQGNRTLPKQAWHLFIQKKQK